MNPISIDGAFDAPAAKTAANNLKSRMKALGVEIPLSHAYEGVAAMLGHASWNVLSASLAGPKANTTAARSGSSEPPFGLMPDDRSPLSVVFARPQIHRPLIEAFELDADAVTGRRNVLRAVTLGARSPFLNPADPVHAGKRTRVAFTSEKPLPISIFDTPLGRRYPTPSHRHRIALFLAAVIRTIHPLEITQSVLEHLEILVDALYEHHSDSGRKSQPSRRAQSSATNAEFELSGLSMIEGETWWNAADRAYAARKLPLSRAAQSNAVPRLEHVIPFVRSYVTPLTDSGETLSDLLARAVSSAFRTYPCFGFSESRFGDEERAAYDRIDYEIDARNPKVAGALYLAAYNAAALEADGAFFDSPDVSLVPPALRYDLRATIALERAETLLEALGGAYAAGRVVEHASSEGRRCVLLTESMEIATMAQAQSATFAVSACSSERQLDAISNLLSLDPEEGDEIEKAMNGEIISAGSVPAVLSRRRNRRTERTVVRLAAA